MSDTEPGGADEAGITGGWAAEFVKGAELDMTPLRSEKRRVGSAVRRVIESVASVDAPIEVMEQAAAALEAIAVLLEDQPPAQFVGFAEAATAPRFDSFLDRSPVLGHANPIAPPVTLRVEDQVVHGEVTFGSAYEGPPGAVHGGWIAAAFDEVLGATQSLSGSGGMTAYLKVDYRSPTPLHEPLRFEGELDRTEGRKIFTVGRLFHGEVLCAEAQALFVSVDFSTFAEMYQRRQNQS